MTTELESVTTFTTADAEALVQSLDTSSGIPVAAIRQCQQHRELVTPFLIQAIEQASARVRAGSELENDAGWLSMYLLWEFQVKEALPVILAAVPGDEGYEIFSDGITEDLPRVLATLASDNLQAIDDYMANRAHDPFSRSAAASSYKYLVRDGVLTRAEAVERLASHLREEREYADEFASFLVCTLLDLNPQEALVDIRDAFARGVIDDSIVNTENVKRTIAGGDEEFMRHQSYLSPTYLEDTVELLRGWACFQPKPERSNSSPKSVLPRPISSSFDSPWDDESFQPSSTTIRNEGPRIGRNDPCPCGSGKKYKKCCMRDEL